MVENGRVDLEPSCIDWYCIDWRTSTNMRTGNLFNVDMAMSEKTS